MSKPLSNQAKLKKGGFNISDQLRDILKKFPEVEVIEMNIVKGYRIAYIFVDHDTDIVIQQKIK